MPGYNTWLDVNQTTTASTKLVWDASVVWTVSPHGGPRAKGSYLDPRVFVTTSVTGSTNAATGATERTTSQRFFRNSINWQVRLELKL